MPGRSIETILTQHLMSLGHWLSDAALDAVGALVKSYRWFSYDLVPMSEFRRDEHAAFPSISYSSTGPTGCARYRFKLRFRLTLAT